jgi:GTP-binding protein HflX
VRAHRGRHRSQRNRSDIPVIALVGYTNAGKSTLFRALTHSEVYIADQLFATLDPTTRRVELPSGRNVLLTDTVGFIQKLPTTLVAAFRATLEEIVEADIILHVVDASHRNVLQHIEAVEDTLAEIEVPSVPRILVWNKNDLLNGAPLPEREEDDHYIEQVQTSALTETGIDQLLRAIEETLVANSYRVRLLLPYQRGELLAALHEMTTVEHQEHTADGVIVTTQLSHRLYERYKDYQIL